MSAQTMLMEPNHTDDDGALADLSPAVFGPKGSSEPVPDSARWHPVCSMEDLEPMWGEAALVAGAQIALVRLPSDAVFAVSQWDPRAKANVMARGIVGSTGGRPTLTSPIHKQSYDLTAGECVSEEGPCLRTYDVRVSDGRIEVKA